MALIQLYATSQQKIFDGSDAELFQSSFQFECDKIRFSFNISELEKNEFENLPDSKLKQALITSAQLTRVDSIISFYKNRQGLRLYYWLENSRIFLFSLGEYQPQRFQCFFEYALEDH